MEILKKFYGKVFVMFSTSPTSAKFYFNDFFESHKPNIYFTAILNEDPFTGRENYIDAGQARKISDQCYPILMQKLKKVTFTKSTGALKMFFEKDLVSLKATEVLSSLFKPRK